MAEASVCRKLLAENLRELRQKKGVSKYRMAQESTVSYAYISKLEGGVEGNPSMETLDLLCAYFGIKPYVLFMDNMQKK